MCSPIPPADGVMYWKISRSEQNERCCRTLLPCCRPREPTPTDILTQALVYLKTKNVFSHLASGWRIVLEDATLWAEVKTLRHSCPVVVDLRAH